MPNIIKQKPKNKVLAKPTKKVKPKKVKKSALSLAPKPTRSKTSTLDYYNCLLTYANQNWHSPEGKKKKITACCRDCKLNAPALNSQREKELVKLITSYQQAGDIHKQIGTSLAKLLKPIK